jgi:transposase, IS30 family
MSHHQLTQYQRHELGALIYGKKHSLREIACLLHVHHSTISRELRRHHWQNNSGYDARQARLQLQHTRLQANQLHRKLSTNIVLITLITKRLERHDSPQQIAGWFIQQGRAMRVCAQTIYDWIYTYARHLVRHLHCRKGKYRRTRENSLRKAFRNKQKAFRSIDARPAHILARKTYGHWEGDTVVGKAHIGSIATFVERKSGYLIAVKLEQGTAAAFAAAARVSFAAIAPHYRKTLTLDNGTEMSNYEEIERHTQLKVYFAHPYHSWERGTNENTNGLLRFYFPKKTSFKDLTQQQLDAAVREINTRPRKRLGYKTPSQVLKARGAIRTGI